MRRLTTTAILAAVTLIAATACDSNTAPEQASATGTPTAQVAQTPTSTGQPAELPPNRLGQTVKLEGVAVTVFRYKAIPPVDGEHVGSFEVKVCNATKAPTEVSGAPWSLIFADDSISQPSWNGVTSPEYPLYGRRVLAGKCVRGWLTSTLPGGRKPVAVEYASEDESGPRPVVTWLL